VIHYNPLP